MYSPAAANNLADMATRAAAASSAIALQRSENGSAFAVHSPSRGVRVIDPFRAPSGDPCDPLEAWGIPLKDAELVRDLNHALQEAVEDALNAGCHRIQEALGETDGGFAGMWFTTGSAEQQPIHECFANYMAAQLEHRLEDLDASKEPAARPGLEPVLSPEHARRVMAMTLPLEFGDPGDGVRRFSVTSPIEDMCVTDPFRTAGLVAVVDDPLEDWGIPMHDAEILRELNTLLEATALRSLGGQAADHDEATWEAAHRPIADFMLGQLIGMGATIKVDPLPPSEASAEPAPRPTGG